MCTTINMVKLFLICLHVPSVDPTLVLNIDIVVQTDQVESASAFIKTSNENVVFNGIKCGR